MKIEVSNGEIVDKISILMLKNERLSDDRKKENVLREIAELTPSFLNISSFDHPLYLKLKGINSDLWNIEDRIREKERAKEFDDEFVSLARSVYITNDQRADVKRQINDSTGSLLVEEKSYAQY
jgi:hypothetical protein